MGIRRQTRRKFWGVLATKSLSSGEAIRNVRAQAVYDLYHPKYRETPVRGVRKIAPLFPGYLFVRMTLENWKPLASTRDVRRVIMFGDRPGWVDDDEVERLRSLENDVGYVEPAFAQPPAFAAGQSVEAKRGIFKDQFGEYVGLADHRGGHRVRVLFEIMGRQSEYEISAFDLQASAVPLPA